MILAIDVDYRANEKAKAAGLLFNDFKDDMPVKIITKIVEGVKPYEPGQFYKRELPCILALLEELSELPECIIVDGYVHLNDNKKGLGAYLFEALGQKVKVIGVAKNAYNKIADNTRVFRGKSKKPLFVTSIGIDQNKAKEYIQEMAGKFRNPSLLKEADRICRA